MASFPLPPSLGISHTSTVLHPRFSTLGPLALRRARYHYDEPRILHPQ